MKRHITLLLLLVFSTLYGNSKQSRFYGRGELSGNFIRAICQDNNGFIWVATANGLNRFDGWTFTRYQHNPNDPSSLSSNYVYSIYADSENILWVGTNNGLQCYIAYEDKFQPVIFPINSQPSVESILELQTGEIWAVTSGTGLFSINRHTLEATPLYDINEACGTLFLDRLYEDSSGNIWIPVSDQQILKITPDSEDRFQMLPTPDNYVYSFAEDDAGNLYAATSQSISIWDEQKEAFVPLKDNTDYQSRSILLKSKKGVIYIGTFGEGLSYIDPDTKEVYKSNEIKNREINPDKIKIEALIEDRNGNLWIGCSRKGLLMIPNESPMFDFWDFSDMEFQSGDCISAVYQDKAGQVWAGAEHGRLMQLDEKGIIIKSYTFQNDITVIYEDSENNFWIGSKSGGLARMDKHTGQYMYIPELQGKYIKSITEDNEKNIYFSVFAEGVITYNLISGHWKQEIHIIENSGRRLKNVWINISLSDSRGRVWFGHYKGIDCYDPAQNDFYKLKCDSVLYTTICYSLLEDKKGHIWIGTNNGVYRYNDTTGCLSHYSMQKGLPDDVICGLAEDAQGNIWCSTYRGLCKIHPDTGLIHVYSSGNGLFDTEYTRGVYFQKDNRDVYFAGIYGITHFHPDSIRKQEISHSPVLTQLYLNNQPVSARQVSASKPIADTILMNASTLNLSYEDNTLLLEFSMMDYNNPENIHFEYRMTNINDSWSQTRQGANRITYNRLPPGKYNLHVRAHFNGVYSPVKTLSIVIFPPWYLSNIARACYVTLLILFVGILIYLLRRRIERVKQEEINEEKLRFFINISHEIRSPITLILSPLSMLMKREHDTVTTKALNTMHRNANRIATLLNQLLDIRKIDKGLMKLTYYEVDLVRFIQDICLGFEYQADKWKIQLNFDHTVESLPVWIDPNNFDKIINNLLDNAFKYTPEGGEISISVHTAGRSVQIYIQDTGPGINEKKLERIFERFYQISSYSSSGSGIGLNLCKTLTELHHGSITAANRKDKQGACFIISIPLGKDHVKEDEIEEAQPYSSLSPQRDFIYNPDDKRKLQPSRSKNRNKILVVDDSEEVCHYLEQELNPFYQVITAPNGAEGLTIALKEMPDLIISDVIMPEIDGFTFLKKIRANTNISHIPVILLTSRPEYDYRIKGWDQGADAILSKPFNMEELSLLCSNLIGARLRLKSKFTGMQDQEEKIEPIQIKSNEEELMERLMTVINNNINNPQLNVELLAKEAGISRVQLHRKLKEIAGISASEFIRNIRLKQAVKLLKTKKINVSQIAYAVGYSSPSLFSTAFKKYYGVSPSEYIEEEDLSSPT